MTFTTNRFDSHFRKFSSGFMHKQQIFNHQVEFCRMDAILVIMEVMAEQGAYLLHAQLETAAVPLPHACIECMADDAYGRGNHAPHIVAGINLNFLLGQDNGYLRMVSTYYAQCFGPTDVLGYDITCFFLRILHYGLSIIKTINTSVICHSSICRRSLLYFSCVPPSASRKARTPIQESRKRLRKSLKTGRLRKRFRSISLCVQTNKNTNKVGTNLFYS